VNLELDRRNVSLSALVALVVLASAFLALASKASASTTVKSDCPAGKICLWAGPTFGGQQSFWNASETGCHALANIDPQSAYNHTSNRHATLTGFTTIGHETSIGWGFEYTGELCINVA
jgi:hypothetical protein